MAAVIRRSPSNLSKVGGLSLASITSGKVKLSAPTQGVLTTGGFTGGFGYGEALPINEKAYGLAVQAVLTTRAKLGSAGLLSPLSVANQQYTPAVAKAPTVKLGINKQPLKQVKNLSLAVQGFYK